MASYAQAVTTGTVASAWLTPTRLRAARHGLWVGVAMVALLVAAELAAGSFEWDAHAYWSAWSHHLYFRAPEQRDAYLYSPAFAQLIWPLTFVPWPIFAVGWMTAVACTYWWLLKPLAREWRLPLFGLCCLDVFAGNIWSFVALVVVLGFRFPSLWVFPLLTKVTPVLGPVWFATRREWRSLALWALTASALVAISVWFDPGLWRDWFRLLLHPDEFRSTRGGDWRPVVFVHGPVLLLFEFPVAIATTIYAALRNRAWLLPIAMVFANPVLTADSLVVLAAIPRLLPPRPQ
jgi:hypothetical protein